MGFALRKPDAVSSPLPPLDVAFQPVFDIGNGRVFAYEALVRGTNGEGADTILSRIKEGQMTAFEEQICALAIGKAAAMSISETEANLLINVAPTTALNAIRSISTAMELAAHAGMPRHRIAFELTERVRTETRRAQAVVLA